MARGRSAAARERRFIRAVSRGFIRAGFGSCTWSATAASGPSAAPCGGDKVVSCQHVSLLSSPASADNQGSQKPLVTRASRIRWHSNDVSVRGQGQLRSLTGDHDSRFGELKIHVDEPVGCLIDSTLATPPMTSTMAEDIDERIERALTIAAVEQAKKHDETWAALMQHIDSAILKVRSSQREEIRAFTSAFTNETHRELAQVGTQVLQAGSVAIAQTFACDQSIDRVAQLATANDASSVVMESAALRQAHDEHVTRAREVHNEHAALFERLDKDFTLLRQSLDSQVSNVRDVEARCCQMELASCELKQIDVKFASVLDSVAEVRRECTMMVAGAVDFFREALEDRSVGLEHRLFEAMAGGTKDSLLSRVKNLEESRASCKHELDRAICRIDICEKNYCKVRLSLQRSGLDDDEEWWGGDDIEEHGLPSWTPAVGEDVLLHGLRTAALNGKSGVVVKSAGNDGRCGVRLSDGAEKAIKVENLIPSLLGRRLDDC